MLAEICEEAQRDANSTKKNHLLFHKKASSVKSLNQMEAFHWDPQSFRCEANTEQLCQPMKLADRIDIGLRPNTEGDTSYRLLGMGSFSSRPCGNGLSKPPDLIHFESHSMIQLIPLRPCEMTAVHFEIPHGSEMNRPEDLTRILEFYLLKCNSRIDET
jgi:hypothetical protein